ncbi:hypothetical protein TYRP_014443 [Tyrophagus putrescentiae]|nr:hypothetical protein TYRP_014443 [Tyrophagus putrescentiae]
MGRDEAQRSALDEAFKLVAFGSIQINTTVVPYADDRNQARRRGMASAAAAAEAAANSVNSVREHRRGEECSPLPPTPPPPPPLLPAPAAAPPLRYYSRPPSHLFLHCLVVLLLCGSRQCFVDCDIFSSSAHIQSLMHLERHLVSSLTNYLENVEQKILQVKTYLGEFAYTAGQTRYAGTYADNLMDNPLQAFQLLKRLTVNWNKIEQVMGDDSWSSVNQFIADYRSLLPDQDDLNGAALALIRLQDTYNLTMSDMANGYISTMNSMIQMSARDCLYLGKSAFNNGYFGSSIEWFEEALARAHVEGNSTASVEEITPFYQMAVEYHDKLDTELKQSNHSHNSDKLKVLEEDNEDYRNYQRLCRGENVEENAEKRHQLTCYYWNNHQHPLLLLRPVKVEMYNRSPFIVMYHELISEKEINTLKEMATPILTRARVQTEENDDEISKVRVSQTAWFSESSHPLVARLNDRVEAVTGLAVNMDNGNCVCGHYIPHFDYLIKDKPEEERVVDNQTRAGDRIATLMFYLSDVISGGATVFTRIGVRVTPVKGAAIFWYNLYRNGEGIIDTVHGACPVKIGSKWVANYWIREHGQTFRRRCSLNADE